MQLLKPDCLNVDYSQYAKKIVLILGVEAGNYKLARNKPTSEKNARQSWVLYAEPLRNF